MIMMSNFLNQWKDLYLVRVRVYGITVYKPPVQISYAS